MSENGLPNCRKCNRPLQRNYEECMYCGHPMNDEEIKVLEKTLDEETLDRQLRSAESMLEDSIPQPISSTGKLIARIIIVALAVGMMIFISWAGEWQPLIIILAVAFFSFPIWHVFRKL